MLVRCNPKCKISDGMTDGSLDLATNSVVCNQCEEFITGVSEYLKKSMKQNGDVIRSRKKKAFVFKCKTCNEDVETKFDSGRLVGKGCEQKKCKIDITSHMKRAIINNEQND